MREDEMVEWHHQLNGHAYVHLHTKHCEGNDGRGDAVWKQTDLSLMFSMCLVTL